MGHVAEKTSVRMCVRTHTFSLFAKGREGACIRMCILCKGPFVKRREACRKGRSSIVVCLPSPTISTARIRLTELMVEGKGRLAFSDGRK